MKWETWINAFLGLWLVVSPWALGFSGTVGGISAAIFGIWTIGSPWMFHLATMRAAMLSDVAAGGLVMLLAFVRLNALPPIAN